MVEGQLKTTADTPGVVAVDLDGTLIAGNSLRIYISEALGLMWRRKPTKAAAIVLLVALRKLRLVSHRRMKFGAIGRIEPTPALKERFAERISRIRRPGVVQILEGYRRMGCTVLLATAAADIYVPWIWTGPFVATTTKDNPGRYECRGRAKLGAVRQFIGPDRHLEAVITDHCDDLELLNAGAVTNYLVAPDAHTYRAVLHAGIPFEYLKG